MEGARQGGGIASSSLCALCTVAGRMQAFLSLMLPCKRHGLECLVALTFLSSLLSSAGSPSSAGTPSSSVSEPEISSLRAHCVHRKNCHVLIVLQSLLMYTVATDARPSAFSVLTDGSHSRFFFSQKILNGT